MKQIWVWIRVLQKAPLFHFYEELFGDLCESLRSAMSPIEESEFLFQLRQRIPRLYEVIEQSSQKIEQELAHIHRATEEGVQLCHILDPDYPKNFLRLPGRPWTFQYLGQPCWNQVPAIGIVGSRESTPATRELFRTEFKEWGRKFHFTVVSGAANGVDQLAHQMAIDLNKPTLAWMPAGLSQLYPSSFAKMSKQIRSNGCLLSEFDFGTTIRKHHFECRNRLIASMSDALMIPQASRKSGTLMTAHRALEYGKPLWVIPGHPFQISMQGNLELLKIGATLVTDCSDLSMLFASEFPHSVHIITTSS